MSSRRNLSGGAIAGIVIAVIAVIVGVVLGLYYGGVFGGGKKITKESVRSMFATIGADSDCLAKAGNIDLTQSPLDIEQAMCTIMQTCKLPTDAVDTGQMACINKHAMDNCKNILQADLNNTDNDDLQQLVFTPCFPNF